MKCGDCTLCCTLLPIKELDKAETTSCIYCNKGCSIYKDRPASCAEFECLYNSSKDMDIKLRPDNTHIIFEKVTKDIYLGLIDPRYKDAWKVKGIQDYVNELNLKGISVILSSFSQEPKRMKIAKNHTQEWVHKTAIRLLKKELNGSS